LEYAWGVLYQISLNKQSIYVQNITLKTGNYTTSTANYNAVRFLSKRILKKRVMLLFYYVYNRQLCRKRQKQSIKLHQPVVTQPSPFGTFRTMQWIALQAREILIYTSVKNP
jgi:hypothetical protein